MLYEVITAFVPAAPAVQVIGVRVHADTTAILGTTHTLKGALPGRTDLLRQADVPALAAVRAIDVQVHAGPVTVLGATHTLEAALSYNFV